MVYVILYSIILFLLAAVAVVFCLLYIRLRTRDLNAKTQRLHMEIEAERAFSSIYGNAAYASFLLIDEAKRPIFVSPNITAIFGVSAEDVYTDLAVLKRNIAREYSRTFEQKYSEWDGQGLFESEFAFGENGYARLIAERAQYGGKEYIAFMFSDITSEQEKTTKLKQELDAALGQAAAKSSFLSNMSHEIRTPMNGVMGMMSLARMNINDPEKVSGYLERAEYLSTFLIGMINDILDISKIESGKMLLFNTDFDVFALADKINNMFYNTTTEKGINFKVETVGFTVRWLTGDELRLTQIITNLVSNANKFTPKGGRVEVTFKQLDRLGDHVQLMIRVRDTGKGISRESIRKILRPFEQEEASTSHNYGGTGLGLAITDNFVRLMGGNIVIDSELGKGSDFSVFLSLPIANVEQDMQKPVTLPKEMSGDTFSYENCRILLAEDNEINAEIAMEILESDGAKVTLAHDGLEALQAFTENPENTFDIILMDIQMPNMDGREATRQIRNSEKKDAKSIIIVALSADAFVEDVKKSEEAGMDAHVSKPVDFAELKKVCGRLTESRKRERHGGAR